MVGKDKIAEKFFERKICLEPYMQPDQYMVPVGQHTHGTSIHWFVNEFGADFARNGAGADVPCAPGGTLL